MNQKAQQVQQKIINAKSLVQRCNAWRVKGAKIVFTNGCFDVLHRGHVDLLLDAASQGNKLVVAINSDASTKRLKGPQRPINKEEDRALLLAAQTFVDAVCLFDEDTPLELIKLVRPEVLVKGGDYTEATIVGASEVKSYGGLVHIVPLTNGYSSTSTISKMK